MHFLYLINAILETLDKKDVNGKIETLRILIYFFEIKWFPFQDKQEPWNWLLLVSMLQQQMFTSNTYRGEGKWIALSLMQLVKWLTK